MKKSAATAFSALVRRDLLLAYRYRAEIVNPLLYFVIIVSLYPLSVSSEPKVLATIASGVIWVAALLSALLSLDSMFRSDYEDGTLEQILMSPHPTAVLVLAKVTAHWITTGLPLVVIAPLLALSLHLDAAAFPALLLSLLIGTPALSLLGAIGIALTVGLRRGGLLLAILILPLYVPILVLSSTAIQLAAEKVPYSGPLLMLGALSVLALTLAPLATAAALRISLR